MQCGSHMQHRFAVAFVFVFALALSFTAAGCYGEIVPLEDEAAALTPDAGTGAGTGTGSDSATLTWQKTIGPLMVSVSCTSCHGTSGKYSVESYAATLAAGTDSVPNVIAGDSSSALVRYCVQRHGGISAKDADRVRSWVMAGARER